MKSNEKKTINVTVDTCDDECPFYDIAYCWLRCSLGMVEIWPYDLDRMECPLTEGDVHIKLSKAE